MLAWLAQLAVIAVATATITTGNRGVATSPDAVSSLLRARLEFADSSLANGSRDVPLQGPAELARLYGARGFSAVWIRRGRPSPEATFLLELLHQAIGTGLPPEQYHVLALDVLMDDVETAHASGRPVAPASLAELDLLLTDSFLLYASHLAGGLAPPVAQEQPGWQREARQIDPAGTLVQALRTGDVRGTLLALEPRDPAYLRLKQALEEHLRILRAGGWPAVAAGPCLHENDRGPRVAALRRRLRITGDLTGEGAKESELYDAELAAAVGRFQERHGLTVDGMLGAETLAQLDVPVSERVRQLMVNLDRWRWLPRDLGAHYLLVNIPGFTLQEILDGDPVCEMRVVVGKKSRPTPVICDELTYVEINPAWNIPPKLAALDILPRIQEDPGYLQSLGIRVYEGWQAGAPEVSPESVDWGRLDGRSLAFRFRQEPGPENALGRIKFGTPNPFNIYLHDTPHKGTFRRAERTFSSGCIRLEKPEELARRLLRDDPTWPPARIEAALRSGRNLTIPLKERMPVYLLYWTAWVDARGVTNFRKDIYALDAPLQAAFPLESLSRTASRIASAAVGSPDPAIAAGPTSAAPVPRPGARSWSGGSTRLPRP